MKNKKAIIVVCVIVCIVLVSIYFKMKNDCTQQVSYVPEQQSPQIIGEGIFKTEGYYAIHEISPLGLGTRKFKTNSEATSYCMSSKFSSKD